MTINNNEKLNKVVSLIFPIIIFLIIAIGIFLRSKFYFSRILFELDETMLSLSYIDKNISDLFKSLEALQEAPPLFLCLVSLIVKIFGFNELSFRFIPFICGCLSVVAFYFLLNVSIRDRLGKIFGLFLFSISVCLIYNSVDFKPYSSDVLTSILLMLFYINIYSKNKLTLQGKYKQFFFYTFITAAIVLFSFPGAFVIFSIVVANCIFEKKITPKSIYILLGIIIASSYVYLMNTWLYDVMRQFWWQGDTKNFDLMVMLSIKYFMTNFSDKYCYTLLSILFFGIIILLKDKKQFALVCILCFASAIIANYLKIWPFEERLILYLLPIILLILAKLFDFNVFKITKGRYEIILKVLLCIILIIAIKIKIPFINYPYEKVIDYSRDDDLNRSLEYRQQMKDMSLYILDNLPDKKILTILGVIYYVKYYNKYYNLNKDIQIDFIDWNERTTEDILNEFINKNMGKYDMLFISRFGEAYFRTWELEELKKLLDEKNIKYNIKNFKSNFYLVYTTNQEKK